MLILSFSFFLVLVYSLVSVPLIFQKRHLAAVPGIWGFAKISVFM
jgi:hypothetical protein